MLQTNPRQRLILKLFASVTTSPFLVIPQYGFRSKSNLTLWLEYFTHQNTRWWNPIYALFEVLIADLVFIYMNIVQRLHSKVYEDID